MPAVRTPGDVGRCIGRGPRAPRFSPARVLGVWWWHTSLMLAMSCWSGVGRGTGTRTGRGGKEGSVEIGQNEDFSFPPGLPRASDGLEQISNHPGPLRRVKGLRSITPRVSSNPAQAMRSGPEGGLRAEAVRCGARGFGSAGPFRCLASTASFATV